MIFQDAGGLRDLFFTIIESLPCGLLLADNQGGVELVNRKAQSMLGLPDSCLHGRSCYELLEQAQKMPPGHADVLRQPGGRMTWDAGRRQGREAVRLAITRQELKSPFHGTSGFFLVVEDITYPALMESRLNRRLRFAAMQEMAVHMSQELKNPLGSLELCASVLKRELDGEPGNERLAAQMLRAVRTMDHLLDNYTTLASLPTPSFSRIEIRKWLEDSVNQLELLTGERQYSYHLQFRHDDAPLEGDFDLLRQLSLNLGLNAVESMAAGGELWIETATRSATDEHPGYFEVKFRDQGHGIGAEALEKIFDPFFTTRNRAGGLGLAIVHHVAEIHGGLIEVASQSGNGSVFTVLLPVGQERRSMKPELGECRKNNNEKAG